MGAKLAKPDKLCINVWGDAAIGFTGMDFETAVRERIPIMSILLNNFSMAIELKVMPIYFASSYAMVKPYIAGFDANILDVPSLKRTRVDMSWVEKKP
jgi:thiamine pyrophosphate-dependent acetolactate synthase large subunit-like protein